MLLLDEMFPATIADQLALAGCDSVAVSAEADLRGASDAELLDYGAHSGLVLVTANIRDFMDLSHEWAAQGREHAGLLFVSSKTFPMSKNRSATIAAALLKRCRARSWPPPGQHDYLRP